MLKQYRLLRATKKLEAIERTLEKYAYDGDPAVWEALRLVNKLANAFGRIK